MIFWLAFIGSFIGTIYALYKMKNSVILQDFILTIVLKNKLLTRFYIKLIQDPYWKDEIRLRNSLNKKVKGQVIGYETKIMFEVCWKYLQTIPSDSQEADIIIAGLSVYSRGYEDIRYAPDSLYYYPQMPLSQIFKICYGDNVPDYVRGDNMILDIIKTFGKHALIDKDLEFDGMISRFMVSDFLDRDWREFTDRFIKYGF